MSEIIFIQCEMCGNKDPDWLIEWPAGETSFLACDKCKAEDVEHERTVGTYDPEHYKRLTELAPEVE